jgi:GTP-binding protein
MSTSGRTAARRPGRGGELPDDPELAAGELLFREAFDFVLGAPELDILPPADRPEIALAGRSNVGKSSLINALVRRRDLARTSNTPGRTQELNYFKPAETRFYLVDMPGYGFAKAPKDKVDAWTALVKAYLRGRPTLKRVLLLIDARHGIKPVDREIMRMLDSAAVTYQIVLTKADKIPVAALEALIAATIAALKEHPAAFPEVLATSSQSGEGIDAVRAVIAKVVSDS